MHPSMLLAFVSRNHVGQLGTRHGPMASAREVHLANIIRRAAERAGLAKHVTAHTLRHSAATWLRQETGDARLVAAHLGHADLSTVSRYAHVAPEELHLAADVIAARTARAEPESTAERAAGPEPAGRMAGAGEILRRMVVRRRGADV
jgi:hypothetical protein